MGQSCQVFGRDTDRLSLAEAIPDYAPAKPRIVSIVDPTTGTYIYMSVYMYTYNMITYVYTYAYMYSMVVVSITSSSIVIGFITVKHRQCH